LTQVSILHPLQKNRITVTRNQILVVNGLRLLILVSCTDIPYIGKFSLLKNFHGSVKISCMKFFLQRNTVTEFLIQEVRCRLQYHPRRLLQQIEKWKKPSVPHLVGNPGATGSVVLTVQAEIGKYACHHSVTAPVAAPRFRDKRGSHECTSLFHTLPRFLHGLNFRGRPIPQKFYSVKFFTRTFYNAEIFRYTGRFVSIMLLFK